MKRFFLCIFLLLVTALPGRGDGGVKTWFEGLDTTRFLLVDKQGLTLSLVGPGGRVEQRYGIACAVNMGDKERKKDHRTPEGRFPISQILNSSSLSHDFRDGKGPVPRAYGPWFLRLDVPGFIDIGIHGTHLPESIGSRSTEGCIRMRNEDIIDLKERVAVGMPVVILPDTLSLPADSLLACLAQSDTIAPPENTESLPEDPGTDLLAKRHNPLPWILLGLALLAAVLRLVKFRNVFYRLFRANETKVHELDYLFWECTTRCNLHCRHCGSDCMAASQDVDMPLEDFLRALDTIPVKERPPEFTVVLTGGEPLLRPDIAEVGRAIRGRGVRWSMVSNGWFYDEAMHRKLMAAGMGALTISLDGLKEEHDWMRGRAGSFDRTERAIAIAAAEPRLNFDGVSCINRRNVGQLEALHDRLAALGVKQWRIFTIIPIGRAKDDPDMHLTNAEFVQLMDFIQIKREAAAAAKDGRMNVTFSCEGYLGRYERKVRQNPFFCRAGITIASVLIDGRICACPNIDRDAFSQGNICQDNLWEVWQTRFQPFRDRRWTRRGRCAGCPVWRDCQGNGMHNWHGDCAEVINCHYRKTLGAGGE